MLDKIVEERDEDRPVFAIFTGAAGAGKTSLAASFPNPIFIRAEDGLHAVEKKYRPDALPVIESIDELWPQMFAILKEEHKYKTLVIDSITRIDDLGTESVLDSDPSKPASLAKALGGWQAGYEALARIHQRIVDGCEMLRRKRGMHVVFLAHSEIVRIDPPDSDPYTSYGISLGKKSMPIYVNNADMIGFVKPEYFVKGQKNETKKAVDSGVRIVNVCTTAGNISKNRYGITKDLRIETIPDTLMPINPFVPYIKSLQESN